ncbi:10229_t:CDS:2 [Dentiscutata erythropus]|uniref:10229_t:CDS:1 n=1 Tax=Dentiscutata erythropus TaxID=1348616 RepID=A0A9N9I3Z0_9GLOM|nr:10229_t:CDS:2 [Dentiscutata erythropus]
MGSRSSKRAVDNSELSDEMSTEKLEHQHGKYGECKECMQQNTGYGCWYHDYDDKKKFPELWNQIESIEKSRVSESSSNENDKTTRASYITHHQANYTSCSLSFANLSQPVNASDILV